MAELNPNIILQGVTSTNPTLLNDPMDVANKAMQNKLYMRHVQQLDDASNKVNKLAMIAQSAVKNGKYDPEVHKALLYQAGEVAPAQEIQAQQTEQQQQDRLLHTQKIEDSLKTIDYGISQLANVKDQQGYDSLKSDMEQLHPGSTKLWDPQYSPDGVNKLITNAIPQRDKVAALHQQIQDQMEADKFDYQKQHDSQQLDLQRQNQQSDEQWKQANYDQRDKSIEATRINNVKPMTEVQGKANIFGQRASAAHDILNGLEDNISTAGLSAKQALGGGILGAAGNAMLSPEQQKVDQGQRDFVNAVLRNESGAAISESEFTNARKQYFPQPGDSKEVIAQKRANREREIKGLNEMAGQNAPVNTEEKSTSQPIMTATNPSTGERVQSTDGGQTWHAIK